MEDIFIRDVNNKNKTKTMKKIIKLTETDLKRLVKKVIKEDDIASTRGYDSNYNKDSELEWVGDDEMDALEREINLESSVAEKIFRLFDHKIGEWSISPEHRVTKETNQYLGEWKENAKNQINNILSQVEYTEQELPENNRTLGGGDETKGGLPKQRGSKPSAMKSR